ncbi:Tetratricopeptide repeats protein [Nakaseomyces bracarensis]|uniref:Tetratricopeptide repeats protein n=1 Tax=Nakaseomyces bracarensis TaxID=273131 RepID=A0ABR4NTY5_9SACH
MSEDFNVWYGEVTRKCSSLAIDLGLSTLAFDQLVKLLEHEKSICTILLLVKLYLKNKDYYNVVTFLVNGRDNEVLSDFRVWKAIALSYFKLHNVQDSLNAVDYALKLNPDDQETLLLKARIMSFLNDASLKQHFESVIQQIEEKGSLIYYQVLLCYLQYTKNTRDFGKSLELFQAFSRDFRNKAIKKPIKLLQIFSYSYQLFVSILYLLEENTVSRGIKQRLTSESPLEIINDFLSVSMRDYNSSISIQPLKILQSQICFMEGVELRECIDSLNLELQIISKSSVQSSETELYHKSILNYMIARNLLKLNPHENAQVAYEYFQNSLSLTPNVPYIWISVASLYLTLGQLEDSLATYSQAISLALSFENALPQKEVSFLKRFAAIAWHGISQVYTVTLQLTNAIEALDHAITLVYQENDTTTEQELTSLRNEYIKLNAQSSPRPNIVYSLPEVPVKMLLEYETYRDSFLYQNVDDLEIIHPDDVNNKTIKRITNGRRSVSAQSPQQLAILQSMNTTNPGKTVAYPVNPSIVEGYSMASQAAPSSVPTSQAQIHYIQTPQGTAQTTNQALNLPNQATDTRTVQQTSNGPIVMGNQMVAQQQYPSQQQPFVVFNHATQKQELVTPQIVQGDASRFQTQQVPVLQRITQHQAQQQGSPQVHQQGAYYHQNDGNVLLKPIQGVSNNEFITKVL